EDKEIAEIKALLVEPTLRLERLDDEIVEMQKAIEKLTAERDSLGAYVAGHKALISPARRLPLDVIQEIFMACIPTHRNCVMSASEAPVLLGRICSSWRIISLSTPRLWATFHVVEPTRPFGDTTSPLFEKKVEQRLETTKTWLKRSGQCPLSISLQCGVNSDPYYSAPHTNPFLQALIPVAPRWQHISFTAPSAVLDMLLPLTQADVPLLKSVTLRQRPYYSENANWGGFLGILRASQISTCSISLAPEPLNGFTLADLPLRWSQLTFLSISGSIPLEGFPSHEILEAISRCPALRSCILVVSDSADTTPGVQSTHPIVELTFLHTLELSCVDSVESTFTHFLPRLSLPGLQNFILRGAPAYGGPYRQIADLNSESQASINRFFAVSTCLESLRMDDMLLLGKSSLVQIIRNLPPTLRQLTIEGTSGPSSLDDDFLAVLTPVPGRPPFFCPALQEIAIYQSGSISETAVVQFVTARMAVGSDNSTLKSVTICFSQEMEIDILPCLQPFIERGLELSIQHVNPLPVQSSPWQGLADAPFNPYPYY
ncbi:hypothetical protein C8R44DRAFT_824126, partial [Mycena epipterygia]